MKRFFCIVIAILMIALPLTSCEERVPPAHEDLDFSQVDISKFTETDKETDYVIIDVGSYGKIVVRLFPDVAPETVENFKKLVSKKFYSQHHFVGV